MLREDWVELGWFPDFQGLIYVKFQLIIDFLVEFSGLLHILLDIRMKTRYRDSTRSQYLKSSKRCEKSWFFIKYQSLLKSGIFKENHIFREIRGLLWISRKYRFLRNFVKKTGFFWTVRYSLSAKFNRFFIILGGSGCRDQKSTDFKKDRKTWFFLVFLGF